MVRPCPRLSPGCCSCRAYAADILWRCFNFFLATFPVFLLLHCCICLSTARCCSSCSSSSCSCCCSPRCYCCCSRCFSSWCSRCCSRCCFRCCSRCFSSSCSCCSRCCSRDLAARDQLAMMDLVWLLMADLDAPCVLGYSFCWRLCGCFVPLLSSDIWVPC